MRLLPFMSLFALAACASSPSPYRPSPPPALTADGLPPAYETCVQHRATVEREMYDVYLDCRRELVFYIVQLPLSQEEKAEAVEQMERKAMGRAQAVVEARYGTAIPRQLDTYRPPPLPEEPGAYVIHRQATPRGELRF